MDRYHDARHVLQVGSFSGPKGESKRLSSQNLTAPHYLKEKAVSRRFDIAPETSSETCSLTVTYLILVTRF
jgi:hypothetical protein